jgi:uncharacterized protein
LSLSTPSPLAGSQRISELDVLRGIALFGVLLGNFSEYILSGFIATSEQLAALGSSETDAIVQFFVELFITDKANTLFSFLFGVSFSMQMQRLRRDNSNAAKIYVRRLIILFFFGFFHLFFINPWDILHMYASLGLILFMLRDASDKALLIGAAFFLLFGTMIYRNISDYFDIFRVLENYRFYWDSAVLGRQSLSAEGDYWGLVTNLAEYTWSDWLLGSSGGSVLYLLGRFLLGAWVGRRDWFSKASEYLVCYKYILWVTLPLGLMLELVVLKTHWFLGAQRMMHTIATISLSVSYVSAIVLCFHSAKLKYLMDGFSFVGRMALTNYILQSFIIGFTYWGFLGGANLAGKIGLTGVLGISIVGFIGLVLLSRIWLSYFSFGPFEWAWRCLTYQRKLPIVKS